MSLCGFEYRPPVPRKIRGGGGVGSGWPGIPAQLEHGRQLHLAELKGAGHRTQLHHSLWNTTRLESCPCGRLQAGQHGYLLYRKALLLAALPDKQAKDLAPHPAVDPAEVVLIANYHTHIHNAPDKRPRQVKSGPSRLNYTMSMYSVKGCTKAPIPTAWVRKSTTRDPDN